MVLELSEEQVWAGKEQHIDRLLKRDCVTEWHSRTVHQHCVCFPHILRTWKGASRHHSNGVEALIYTNKTC
jgi:hypothetical protein